MPKVTRLDHESGGHRLGIGNKMYSQIASLDMVVLPEDRADEIRLIILGLSVLLWLNAIIPFDPPGGKPPLLAQLLSCPPRTKPLVFAHTNPIVPFGYSW